MRWRNCLILSAPARGDITLCDIFNFLTIHRNMNVLRGMVLCHFGGSLGSTEIPNWATVLV